MTRMETIIEEKMPRSDGIDHYILGEGLPRNPHPSNPLYHLMQEWQDMYSRSAMPYEH